MKRLPLILIPDRVKTASIEQKVLGPKYKVVAKGATYSSQIADSLWGKAEAILAWHDLKFTKNLISRLKNCKVIVRVGVGFDNIDLKAAGEKGILICNVPDYGTSDVADHAIALMLSLSCGVYAFSEQVRSSNDNWRWDVAGKLHRLKDARLGIIGLGRIGTAVALRAKAFGLRVGFHDSYISDGYDKALDLVRFDKLESLLSRSNIVSIHAPLNSETEKMADSKFFSKMRKEAVFINTARGAIVDFDALTNALKSGRLRAAGLDVLPQEPPDNKHPLIKAWRKRESWIAYRLIITPHAAFYCEEAFCEMRVKAAQEAKRVLQGKSPRNCVNKKWL